MNPYVEERKKLVEQLGGKCVQCGSTRKLELDHVKPRKWRPWELSKSRRLRVYQRAASKGQLQVLCEGCHAAKGARDRSGHWLFKLFSEPDPF